MKKHFLCILTACALLMTAVLATSCDVEDDEEDKNAFRALEAIRINDSQIAVVFSQPVAENVWNNTDGGLGFGYQTEDQKYHFKDLSWIEVEDEEWNDWVIDCRNFYQACQPIQSGEWGIKWYEAEDGMVYKNILVYSFSPMAFFYLERSGLGDSYLEEFNGNKIPVWYVGHGYYSATIYYEDGHSESMYQVGQSTELQSELVSGSSFPKFVSETGEYLRCNDERIISHEFDRSSEDMDPSAWEAYPGAERGVGEEHYCFAVLPITTNYEWTPEA